VFLASVPWQWPYRGAAKYLGAIQAPGAAVEARGMWAKGDRGGGVYVIIMLHMMMMLMFVFRR
jgi:hypothetical protein